MRVLKKKELYQALNTLTVVHQKMQQLDGISVLNILQQCQEMAIAIGTEIEDSEGEGTQAVVFLEEYCELLYQTSLLLENEVMWKQAVKNLSAIICKISDSIKVDIPDSPYEIVFMPYKASMWDALDSIYRSAMVTENCHVVVMPVPYYNMNRKDGQVDMHYEGNQFPEDIPITDFRTYSLEQMHPDVIFIHNPYDEYNYVTQLPEQYFSSALVNYTEHLIYVPYFVTDGSGIKEAYCKMPAVQNAWRTIVQSEAVREDYIKYGADPEKIVALGSPKFDRVVELQKNPPVIPKEWKTVLEGKKIFLLNTHLHGIISDAEKMIEKLHAVFDLFKGRDDVALLWRPHPLSIETAKSMNPEMLDKYLQLIEDFKSLPNGVYDETSDVHRAIAISDAYIGNMSSLVTLYGITGKPIYILNMKENLKERRKEETLSFSCAVELDNYLWVSGDDYNGLFKICLETGCSEFVIKFDEKGERLLYKKVIAVGRKLFFIPYMADKIAEYNVDTKEIKYYEICGFENETVKFGDCIVKNGMLYLFPLKARDIICLDIKNGKVMCCAWDNSTLPNEITEADMTMFIHMVNVDNIVYLPCLRTNVIVKLYLNDFRSEVIQCTESKEGFIDISYRNNILYLLTVGGNIVSYNVDSKEEKLFWINSQKRTDGKCVFYKMLFYNDYLWLIPGYGEHIVRINVETREEVEIIEYPKQFKIDEKRNDYKWLNGEIRDDVMYLYPHLANMLLHWDKGNNIMSGNRISMPVEKEWKQQELKRKNAGCIYYEAEYAISYFVDTVAEYADTCEKQRKMYFQEMQSLADGSSGKTIWRYIEKLLKRDGIS